VNRADTAIRAGVIDLLKTFATQSALAMQNARLFREVEEKSRNSRCEPAQERVPRQHVARAAHAAQRDHRLFGSLSERMFGEINEKQAEYIGDILQSGQHLCP
jgi:hypothetical protein